MKTLHLIKKSEAMRIMAANPGSRKFPYCTGKYKKMPSELLGSEMKASDDVLAVYAERRSDNFGGYTKLMCVYAAR